VKLRQMRLMTAWLLTTLLSIVVALIFYVGGRLGDCGAREVDGQCGMSSWVGLWFGIFAGSIIFITMTSYFLVVAHRRRANAGRVA
jgi:hypothetical protein